MKIGVSTASLYPLETELALEKIGEAGVKTTEIFFNCESELKPSFVDMLLDIKKDYGLDITAIHPTLSLAESFMIFSEYERRFYESLQKFTRYSEVARELGAKYIILHGGKPNGLTTDEEYCEKFMALNRETQKNGVTVLQENVVRYRSGDIEFLRSMKDILGDDAQFCFDIKQAIRCGYNPIDLVNEFIENIKHFHISDHSLASDCLLPLNGNFDFKGFFEILKYNNFGGACNIEVYKNAYKNPDEIFVSHKKLLSI
ncbi:MAG: sugar phosphate isomerase/epimerase [Ruminococcaceae bacterium]|nr:sugar phosphate isomerase/epimerase [Oscillospiraceae bacterium]